ncbi:MAG: DUF5305 domain-containing protein [Oscillospiraceae bacterium]|nr:DUF5305 domain-containing protein [Oscillospiraceae bacterium]
MKNYSIIVKKYWTVALFSLIVAAFIVIAIQFLFAYFREETFTSASGRHNLSFSVNYFDGTIFGEENIPLDQSFLMSYTDYIELENSFTANFSQRMDIYYNYHAQKRFIIRHMATADALTSPVIFQKTFPLVETSGRVPAEELTSLGNEYQLYLNSNEIVRVYPLEFIQIYLDFINEHRQQLDHMASRLGGDTMIQQGMRGFSAELFVDFTHSLRNNANSATGNLNQNTTYSYRIPLTAEVYTITTMGTPNFEWESAMSQSVDISLLGSVVFVALFTLSSFGLLHSIKKLTANPNIQQQQVNDILKKYSHEIVISDNPIPLEKYDIVNVLDFKGLLKLSISLSKHITCYKNEECAEFVVIIDEFAYLYNIQKNTEGV